MASKYGNMRKERQGVGDVLLVFYFFHEAVMKYEPTGVLSDQNVTFAGVYITWVV